MTPVVQTKFFEPDRPTEQQRGNCLSAVVASLLDLPMEAVPDFVQIDVSGGPNWWQHLWWYLDQMGHRMHLCNPRTPPSGFYTVAGLSARATETHPIHHICIYRDGRLVHDPHPEGTGLLTEESGWYLEQIRDLPLGQGGVMSNAAHSDR